MTVNNSCVDKDFVKFMKTGEEAAFTVVYNRYWKKLLAIAYSHTKDKFTAEEVVQEVFTGLWLRRAELKIDNPDAYLATAIKFSIFKFYHKQKRRDSIESETGIKNESSTISEELIDARFTQEYISGQVETLPKQCKLVFKYSRFSELSIPEISREMGIAEKTVEAHLTKGLKVLRLRLRDIGIFMLMLLNINLFLRNSFYIINYFFS